MKIEVAIFENIWRFLKKLKSDWRELLAHCIIHTSQERKTTQCTTSTDEKGIVVHIHNRALFSNKKKENLPLTE
jgi:hypothetical protein